MHSNALASLGRPRDGLSSLYTPTTLMHLLYEAAVPVHSVVACVGLEACGSLERVDVRGNALASLGWPTGGPGPLAGLTALTALDAGANRLAAFPAPGDLPPALLAHLSLDCNRRAPHSIPKP